MGSSLDPVRYSVEAEKYRAAAGYMASSSLASQHLYHGGSVDPVTAAAAKYLETSKNFNEGSKNFLPENVLNKGLGDNYGPAKNYGSETSANNDANSASKAYLETAKLYMDSKSYAAEVQRAYMDAAAKSFHVDKSHDVNTDGMDIKSERNNDGSRLRWIFHSLLDIRTQVSILEDSLDSVVQFILPSIRCISIKFHQEQYRIIK